MLTNIKSAFARIKLFALALSGALAISSTALVPTAPVAIGAIAVSSAAFVTTDSFAGT